MDLLASQDWRLEKTIRDELFTGLRYVMCARAFRPGYGFFHGNHLAGFFDGVQRDLNPELFASLDHTGRELGMSGKQINDGKKHPAAPGVAYRRRPRRHHRAELLRTPRLLPATRPADSARRRPSLGSPRGHRMLTTSQPLNAVVRAKDNAPPPIWWIPTTCAAAPSATCWCITSTTTPRNGLRDAARPHNLASKANWADLSSTTPASNHYT